MSTSDAHFDLANSSSLPFDFTVQSTIISHLSSLTDHLSTLSNQASSLHPLSSTPQPAHEAVLADILTLTASLQNYNRSVSQLVQPINAEPMVLDAERFTARLKEHASFLARLEARRRAVTGVKKELDGIDAKRGGQRRDLRFTHKRIETLIKQLGYPFAHFWIERGVDVFRLLVYGDDTSSELPHGTHRFTIGGKLIVIDIDFQPPPLTTIPSTHPPPPATITNISLSIAPADDDRISSLGPPAAQILLRNIHSGNGAQFVRNITNLARWDGCSDTEGLNAFAVLRAVEDALQTIHHGENRAAHERTVQERGWGRPVRNANEVIGLSIFYGGKEENVGVGVEVRRARYVHAPLQTVYLPAEEEGAFVAEDVFGETDGEVLLDGRVLNWIVMEPNMDILPTCSFVMDLDPAVVMSVHGAKRVCEIIGYGGWNDVMEGVKEEWTETDTMLEDLLVRSPTSAWVLITSLTQSRQTHDLRFHYLREK
jgi:Mediator of RNA polymerase II transcription subunit 1